MDSKNKLLDDYSFPKEDKLDLKLEPIDVDLIKKEKNDEEEECFVVPGIVESLKVEKDLIKEEIFEKNKIDDCSSSNVRNIFFISTLFLI